MKNTVLIILLLAVAALSATYDYYPMTSIVEAGVEDGNPVSNFAYTAINTVLGQSHPGEFIAARLYHNSGDLSEPSIEQRIQYYGISAIPTVVFNGSINVIGAAPSNAFEELLNSYIYSASPLKIQITSFDNMGGIFSGTVTMLDSTLVLTDANLVLMLVEDNLVTATNVTREVLIQNISLSGAGDQATFDVGFTIDANWNQNNFWAIALVQTDDRAILQSASTLPLPTYNMRCAMDWDGMNLVAEPNSSLIAEPFWLFNTGSSDNMQIRIVVDSGPTDWYFNYCDEEGNCYPGDTLLPLNMSAGDARAFHLNVWLGSTGLANFHFQITSPSLGTYTVPFKLRTSDYVSNEDHVLPVNLSLEANYPNPFRGRTSFRVASAKAVSQASIQIYNVKGQKIAETPMQELRQGVNSIVWQAPVDLPAGVYFYRLKDQPDSLRRMLLLK